MSENFILAPGEEFLQCPYNLAHQITNSRMLVHLNKCRMAYLKSPEGKRCVMERCKYNNIHHVPYIELEIHHETCPDKAIYLRLELEKQKQSKSEDNGDRQRREKDGRGHASSTPGPSSSGGTNAWGIKGENWEDEACGYQPGYDPKIKLKQEPVLYNPPGMTKTERKKFREEVRSRHAARSLGQQIDLPLANDYETKPELMAQEDKKVQFPVLEAAGTAKGERNRSKIIKSDKDAVEAIDFGGIEVPPATASSAKAANLDIKSTITIDHGSESEGTSDEQRESTTGSPSNFEEAATNGYDDLDNWQWPNDDSDIWPDDTDDFEGQDPYA